MAASGPSPTPELTVQVPSSEPSQVKSPRARGGKIPVPSRSRSGTPVGSPKVKQPARVATPNGKPRSANDSLSPTLRSPTLSARSSLPRSSSALSNRSDRSEGASSVASGRSEAKKEQRGRGSVARGRGALRGGKARGGQDRQRTSSNLSRSSAAANSQATPAPTGPGLASPSVEATAQPPLDPAPTTDALLPDQSALLAQLAAELSDESLPTTPFPVVDLLGLTSPNLPRREADPFFPSASTTSSPARPAPVPISVAVEGSTLGLDAMASSGDESLVDIKPPSFLERASSSFVEPAPAEAAPVTPSRPLPPLSPSPTLPTSPIRAREDPFASAIHVSGPPTSASPDREAPAPTETEASTPSRSIREGSEVDGGQWDHLAALSLSAFGMRERARSATPSELSVGGSGQRAVASSASEGGRIESVKTVGPDASPAVTATETTPEPDVDPLQRPAFNLPPSFQHLLDPALHRDSPRNSAPTSPVRSIHHTPTPSRTRHSWLALTEISEPAWSPAPYGSENVPTRFSTGSASRRPTGATEVGEYLDRLRRELHLTARNEHKASDSPFAEEEEEQELAKPRLVSPQSRGREEVAGLARPQGQSRAEDEQAEEEESRVRQQQAKPPSLTVSVWRGGGDLRTRLMALGASLAINLVLPFVNGVMLGFGEIAAREIVGFYLGWGPAAGGRRRWWEPVRRSTSGDGERGPSTTTGRGTAGGLGLRR